MESKIKRQRKLLFQAVEVTPVYRPLKFPLHREAVGDSDDLFDLSRATSWSTNLSVPATLGRRNLSICWWLNCPRKCRAYKRELIEDACDACFRIRGVREAGRTALSLRMVEINSCGDLRVVARHTKTIKIVDKNGVRVKSLFDCEGRRRVVYLIVRDRRGPREPTHTMAFAIRFIDSEESSGVRKVESDRCAVSCRKSLDSSHRWTSQPSKESPRTSTREADTSDRLAVTVSPKSARRSIYHGCSHASFASAAQVLSNDSVEKVVTPTRSEGCAAMVIETTPQRTSQQQYAPFGTPESRTSNFFDQSTGLKGLSSGSRGRVEDVRGDLSRTAGIPRPIRRRLSFEPEAPSDDHYLTSPVCESDQQRLSEPDGDLVTQVERLIALRSTQDSTQSAVLLLPREQLLTLIMQDATQTGLCVSPKPQRDVTHCRSLTLRGWRRARAAAAPYSFRRAVVDLIVHENQQEDASETEKVLWLPQFLDCGCVFGPS
jgi:hypothetical protein